MNHNGFLLNVIITPRANELSWLKTLIESCNNQMCSNTFDTQYYVAASISFYTMQICKIYWKLGLKLSIYVDYSL